MLEQVLFHLKNWFIHSTNTGAFTIENGSLALPEIVDGQYYRIVGSIFNDGLHRMGETDLVDESFEGTVYGLAIPAAVISLAMEVEEWQGKNDTASPFQSESFGGYSYTRATDSDGGAVTWQSQFRKRLNPWRKV